MGTEYHISWVSKHSTSQDLKKERSTIQQGVNAHLIAINKSMSTYDTSSELSLLNKNFTQGWQDISIDLYRVLMMSQQVNVQSLGAFDVTVGPLVNLWGFGPSKSKDQVPNAKDIGRIREKVGAEALTLRMRDESFQLALTAPRYIDLSAIAKGYAVDVLGRYLQRQGIDRYLVEVGGEIIAHGKKDIDSPWRIAIEAPSDQGRNAQIIIPLNNLGIATSGDYRNFFEQDGERYSHTIDGRTGYPVKHNLASVSVLHSSVAMADAWATALTVAGVEAGLEIAEKNELAAYFIVRTPEGFEQYTSRQFEQLILD